MSDQTVTLLVNAGDLESIQQFAAALESVLSPCEVVLGPVAGVPSGSPPPPRCVVWATVRDRGGTVATRRAIREAVDRALRELDVSVDSGPIPDTLDMVAVFL